MYDVTHISIAGICQIIAIELQELGPAQDPVKRGPVVNLRRTGDRQTGCVINLKGPSTSSGNSGKSESGLMYYQLQLSRVTTRVSICLCIRRGFILIKIEAR